MKNVSLSFRLTLWFSAIFLAGFLVFGIALYLDLSYSLSSGRDRTLSLRAARLEYLLRSAVNTSAEHRATKFAEFADATPEGNLIHLLDARGRRIYPQRPDPSDFPWPAFSDFGRRYRDAMYGERHFRVFVEPVQVSGESYFIAVAGQLEDNRSLLGRFSTGCWFGNAHKSFFRVALCASWLARMRKQCRSAAVRYFRRRIRTPHPAVFTPQTEFLVS